ncbi:hypothetical protein Scep_011453 [Stephania cephalantha]|uniref:Uncharacterized protein n=1 Tax=Stephania cephalantha TaxID=152367 RepID=A0AAP0JFC1_9MAGN
MSLGQGKPQHSEELWHSFHAERKFFKVLRKKLGRVCISESTLQLEFRVDFTNDETFWLARTCDMVVEDAAVAQRKVSIRNERVSVHEL